MAKHEVHQWTNITLGVDDALVTWIESFLIDRKAQNMASGTLYFYKTKLKLFHTFCEGQVITNISQITPDTIRRFLLHLGETGHNPGGIHGIYRALRAFLLWYEEETEPEGWKNPIRKVQSPRVPVEQIEPVEIDTVKALIESCKGSTFTAVRDKALLLFLLDTGARASEVVAVNLGDVNMVTGEALIRQGKGRKPRTIFLGQKTRKVLRAYLKHRGDTNKALWVTDDKDRLTYWGLNEIIKRRSKTAKVDKPCLHDFRRAFAINFLRNGGDIYSLQKLMGHSDLQVLRRYLAQTNEDLRIVHHRASPVDQGGF